MNPSGEQVGDAGPILAVMAVMTFIIKPIQESSEGIGNTIREMNPE